MFLPREAFLIILAKAELRHSLHSPSLLLLSTWFLKFFFKIYFLPPIAACYLTTFTPHTKQIISSLMTGAV